MASQEAKLHVLEYVTDLLPIPEEPSSFAIEFCRPTPLASPRPQPHASPAVSTGSSCSYTKVPLSPARGLLMEAHEQKTMAAKKSMAPLLAAVGNSLTPLPSALPPVLTGDAVEPDHRRGILAVLSVGLVNTIITATLDNPIALLAVAVTLVAVAILYMTVFGWGAE